MIGVCIPAHNEEQWIGRCLASVAAASRHPGLAGEAVHVVVVADACQDRTVPLAAAWNVTVVEVACRNVGLARAAGARRLLDGGARWLAFTDADTAVSPAWLFHQLSLRADVVCGTVGVTDWSGHGPHADRVRAAFHAQYQDRDGHRHVHGANLGIHAEAYRSIGGFEALACSEDQVLVDRLVRAGVAIAWSALPRVATSGRAFSRIEGGFASTLRKSLPQAASGAARAGVSGTRRGPRP